MKKILNVFSCFTFIVMAIFPTNACGFFDNDSHVSKPLYEYEKKFNGTSSEYNGYIVDSVCIMSWKKYSPNWQEFIKKYKQLNFSDDSIIKVETPTYPNYVTDLPFKIIGPNLSVNTSKINESNNKYDETTKIWNLKFDYKYLWSVRITLTSFSFFWHDDNNGKIYLNTYLDEWSRNAQIAAQFNIKIGNYSLNG